MKTKKQKIKLIKQLFFSLRPFQCVTDVRIVQESSHCVVMSLDCEYFSSDIYAAIFNITKKKFEFQASINDKFVTVTFIVPCS